MNTDYKQFSSKNSEEEHGKHENSAIAKKKLILVCLVCLVFMIIELIGGVLAGSLAIMADAAHLVSDVAGFLISIYSIHLSQFKSSKTHTFGYFRAEVIGAMASVILIWILTAILLWEAIHRTFNPDTNLNAKTMLITAVIALVFNFILAMILHSGEHGHSCGHHHHENHHNHHEHHHDHSHKPHEEEMRSYNQDHCELNHSMHKDSKPLPFDVPTSPPTFFKTKTFTNLPKDGLDFTRQSQNSLTRKLSKISATPVWMKQFITRERIISEISKHKIPPLILNYAPENEEYFNVHSHPQNKNAHSSNLNVRAAMIHIIGDILQSVGVIIAALVIYCFPKYKIIDPLTTLLFAFIVVWTTISVVYECSKILMEANCTEIDINELIKSVEKIKNINKVQDIKVWNLTPDKSIIIVKVSCSSYENAYDRIKDFLTSQYDFFDVVIEIKLQVQ